MEAKKWAYVVLFSFVLLGLLSFIFRQQKELTEAENQGHVISNKMFQWLMGMGFSELGLNKIDYGPDPVVISPNLSTCHQTFKRNGQGLIYCCPPKPESEERFIDFQIPSPSSAARIRRPAHLVDDDYIAKYKKAIKIMRSLPYDDPRSFRRQADMHCIYCNGAYNQKHSDTLLMVHRSWLFFPWHRMLVYFHERILGSLIGDDTFALPFWNWDAPEGMAIPKMFMEEPFLDLQRDEAHLPPKVVDLSYSKIESGLGPDEQIAANLAFMYNQMVSGAKKPELFMGCPIKAGKAGYCNGPGTIESAPHNTLHLWVGNPLNPMRKNMGVFYAAGRDPIFYAHHSNVDRLWEVWKELRGYEPEIVDLEWLDSYFFFHDENAQLVRIKIRDVLNITNIGYRYEKVDLPWLNARPRPSVSPKIAQHMLGLVHNVKGLNLPFNYSYDFGPMGRVLDTIVTVKLHRPNPHRTKAQKVVEEEVLVIYGIYVMKDMVVKFDVFVNAIDGIGLGPESTEFAGCYVHVPRGVTLVMNKGDAEMSTKSDLKLGISELLEDLEADGDENIWVTLVPRYGTGVNTTIDSIRIEYML